MKTMPSVFVGHGSPMLALDDNNITHTLTSLGQRISATMAALKPF